MTTRACDCCTGSNAETPRAIENPPGLSAIAYRVGRHGTFKESMLARLSSGDFPALARLRTRADTDFSIALCDATALMLDVLTFYQERLANEAFLRTAHERRSISELARLIGYQLAPGAAANVHIAFMLAEAPGQPSEAAQPIEIPAGTKVQSEPGADEKPQTFETVESIHARPQWNAIPVQSTAPLGSWAGRNQLWLGGAGLQLKPGDVILLVEAQVGQQARTAWAVRVLEGIEVDGKRNLTRVSWSSEERLAADLFTAGGNVRVYALRQRAALFGHNAPDPNLLSNLGTNLDRLAPGPTGERAWSGYDAPAGTELDLDSLYPGIAPGSWAVVVDGAALQPGALGGEPALFRVRQASQISRVGFSLSAKVTRLTFTTSHSVLALQTTFLLGQSEELALAAEPIGHPMYGRTIALARVEPGLVPAQALAVTGKCARLRAVANAAAEHFAPMSEAVLTLCGGGSLQIAGAPVRIQGDQSQAVAPEQLPELLRDAGTTLRWTVIGLDGKTYPVTCGADRVVLVPARDDDEAVSEIACIDDQAAAVVNDGERSVLSLETALANCYDRAGTTINANVARATHGETVSEILGSGDASSANQRFVLQHAPVTQVSAATDSGRASTLQVWVNDLRWEERPTLYAAGGADRAFAVSIDDDGRSTVSFGDGSEGSRLPSGVLNVRAAYRKGLGAAGNVRTRGIKTLLSRPLGVAGAINPEPATGGEDPEFRDDARENAPLTVLTLGRVVSVSDYADFARNFAGIAKAHAVWLPSGAARGIFVTVAGVGGVALDPAGDTCKALTEALRRYGDRMLPFMVRSYRPIAFKLAARVKVSGAADADAVLVAVAAALRAQFSFAARRLGQPVTRDEVVAAMHEVATVEAVDLQRLYRADPAAEATLEAVLPCDVPAGGGDEPPQPAELLILDLDSLDLVVMT